MRREIAIASRPIGPGHAPYIVAELSANHHQNFEEAALLVREAKARGAHAVKLQTYTADTITIDCREPWFRLGDDSAWAGRTLYDLYQEAYTPWEWQPRLKALADEIGIALFSAPFDDTAVELLESMEVPAYKIASFELVDIPLIRRVARTRKPIILSTGKASAVEISDALDAIRDEGAEQVVVLKCTSAYPAPPEEMNLRTIPDMAAAFGVPVGLSDHTLGNAAALAAVALGASLVEKHLTMSRAIPGPDSAFSMEPAELEELVRATDAVHRALGRVQYGVTPGEESNVVCRRSLFVIADVEAGQPFTPANVRSIRPSHGLAPRHLPEVLGRKAARAIKRGTPLAWELVAR